MKRSYFLMGICGEDTDRPCPDPALPMPLTNSGYINHDGELVLPEGVSFPRTFHSSEESNAEQYFCGGHPVSDAPFYRAVGDEVEVFRAAAASRACRCC